MRRKEEKERERKKEREIEKKVKMNLKIFFLEFITRRVFVKKVHKFNQ